ncbi:MAG: outer membrane protein assembly factor BamB [Rhodanobacteraceae bacterium]|nr:outer membrane protein assembly factor BamB [Rhodanobacteraceae bacterium]MBL0041462.1 outer membrane protein assembly factor BamB [Xanthomonadales bacterium]MBP6078922.1 outer membrane protein assembly factor BamB [Xanthomonadales bacterium]MBP7623358.1 outer membrane protein assembly factor BamB [Xanthomonadales bacterium]
MKRSVLLVAMCVLGLSGCEWLKGRSTKDNLDPPAELVDFEPVAPVSKAWSLGLGDGIERSGTQPRPVESDGVVFASDLDGSVVAIDLLGGKQRWSIDADKRLSSGPGVGEGLVVVGGLDGDVIALDRDSGSAKWATNVSSEVLANPVIEDGIVVVRSNDGRVFGLNATDGSRVWLFDRGVPLISLRGNATPVVRDGQVYVGYDNGKFVALQLADGTLQWEQTIAAPEGRTELERMGDIDGEIVASDGELYMVTYRGQAAALARDSGRVLWTRDMSSFTGVSVAADEVYLSDADGAVWALDRRSGSSLWKQDALAHRWLTTPAVYGDYLAVGDYDGYLHILTRKDGATAARFHPADKAIRAAPLVVGAHVLIESTDGELAAFVLEAAN